MKKTCYDLQMRSLENVPNTHTHTQKNFASTLSEEHYDDF